MSKAQTIKLIIIIIVIQVCEYNIRMKMKINNIFHWLQQLKNNCISEYKFIVEPKMFNIYYNLLEIISNIFII